MLSFLFCAGSLYFTGSSDRNNPSYRQSLTVLCLLLLVGTSVRGGYGPDRLYRSPCARFAWTWALENVVKNALDALAGRGGKISIYAREIGGKWVSLRIRDTGIGVDPEVRDKIFEPGVSSKTSGWGVGLALSRRIIEGVHGGRIELLQSSAGTTFEISLPTADA